MWQNLSLEHEVLGRYYRKKTWAQKSDGNWPVRTEEFD